MLASRDRDGAHSNKPLLSRDQSGASAETEGPCSSSLMVSSACQSFCRPVPPSTHWAGYSLDRSMRVSYIRNITLVATQPTDSICGASMMIRPSVLARIGGMDENHFLYFEETDFCYRAKQAGFPTWYVSDSRVMHMYGTNHHGN